MRLIPVAMWQWGRSVLVSTACVALLRPCGRTSAIYISSHAPSRVWNTVRLQGYDICSTVQVPNGAAGYYLLGKICALSNRHDEATHYYAAALTLDPLLWSAYEELCNLGKLLTSTIPVMASALVASLLGSENPVLSIIHA